MNVLAAAKTSAPHFAGEVKAELSVPSFYKNFDVENNCLKNDEIEQQLITVLSVLK